MFLNIPGARSGAEYWHDDPWIDNPNHKRDISGKATWRNSEPINWGKRDLGFWGNTRRGGTRALRAWSNTAAHAKGVEFLKYDLGIHPELKGPSAWSIGKDLYSGNKLAPGSAGKLFGRTLGRAFLGYSIYSGYQEGGVLGAVKGGVEHLMMTYAMGAAWGAVAPFAGSVAAGVIGGSAIAAGVYFGAGGSIAPFVRPWVKQHQRNFSNLELGTPVVDNFGTVSTMRQRSLAAIQNSKLGGRAALGNEGALLYTPYAR